MVQTYLAYKADTAVMKGGRPSQSSQESKVKITNDVRLVGKHYASKNELRWKCSICAYKINSLTRNSLRTTVEKVKNILLKHPLKVLTQKNSVPIASIISLFIRELVTLIQLSLLFF